MVRKADTEARLRKTSMALLPLLSASVPLVVHHWRTSLSIHCVSRCFTFCRLPSCAYTSAMIFARVLLMRSICLAVYGLKIVPSAPILSSSWQSSVRVMLPPSMALRSMYSSSALGVVQNMEQMFMSTMAEYELSLAKSMPNRLPKS